MQKRDLGKEWTKPWNQSYLFAGLEYETANWREVPRKAGSKNSNVILVLSNLFPFVIT